jgi:uncharacterized protein with PIN domain
VVTTGQAATRPFRLRIDVDPSLVPLLGPARRGAPVDVVAAPSDTLGHVVESVGIPLTEVGTLLHDGVPARPADRARPGTVRVGPVLRPQPAPTDPPRFLLDVHLGRLARHLRLLGLDAAWSPDPADAEDAELARRSGVEGRVLLTRDRRLLHRRSLAAGALVRGSGLTEQLTDVLDRFAPPLAPWTRCMACGAVLRAATADEGAGDLRPGTSRTYRDFSRCPACGRVYWRGAHARRLEAVVTLAQDVVRRRREAP